MEKTFKPVDCSCLKPGDEVYLSTKENAKPYGVIDVGAPFILLENLRTHFCSLYRATAPLYIKLD